MKKNAFKSGIKVTAIAFLACLILTQALGCNAKKNIKQVAVTVSLDQTSISILAGTTQTLTPKLSKGTITEGAVTLWETDNPSIATVDSTGVVTAVAAGTCQVKYTYNKKIKAACWVTVNPSSKKTTVLMYHSIAYEAGNDLRVPAEDFDTEMKWLSDNGYATLSLDQLNDSMVSRKPFPEKSVVITLDDGYADNYDSMYPIIKKYNLHATIFMITSKIGTPGFLSAAQLKEMSDSGFVSIESHTVTHPFLDTLSYDAQVKELSDSKQTLENLLGKKVEYLAYPTGRYNKNTLAAVQSLGYKMCFKMEGGTGSLESSPYEFPRAYVVKKLQTLIDAANGKGN